MPVDMTRYPEDWPAISNRIRFVRGGGQCECEGECGTLHVKGRCTAKHGEALDEHMANARVTRNAVKLKTLIDNGQLSMGI